MNVNNIGNHAAALQTATSSQPQTRQATGGKATGEAAESPRQERQEKPSVQAAEGETGGLINTYA
ncbi:MAG: hypothetical protein AB7U30_02125 [Sulfuricellaceae bacterium]|jgi:hypothetical protein